MRANSFRLGVLFFTLAGGPAAGQELMDPDDSDFAIRSVSDPSILESDQSPRELTCAVRPIKPAAGNSLSYRAGYSISIPLKELSSGARLVVVTRVTRQDGGKPLHFIQLVAVGRIPENTDAVGEFTGHFDVEEGRHRVDLVLRDRQGRACSSVWSIQAASPVNDSPPLLGER